MKNIHTIKKLLLLLTADEKKSAIHLTILLILVAILDAVGVASIMPLIAVLSNPNLIESNEVLSRLKNLSQLEENNDFLFAFGVLIFVFIVLTQICKAFAVYLQLRFSLMKEYSITARLFECYLAKNYEWFLGRHTSDLKKIIFSEVNHIIFQALIPTVTIIAQGLSCLALIFLLFLVDPFIAIMSGFIFGLMYWVVFLLSKKALKKIGTERLIANRSRFLVIDNAFGAIKEIKLNRLEMIFTNSYKKPARMYADHQAMAQIIGQLPRFALEALAFGGMTLLMLFLIDVGEGLIQTLPILALYTFAAYRLLPSLQQIYFNLSVLNFSLPTIDLVYRDLTLGLEKQYTEKFEEELDFKGEITMEGIKYSYPNSPNITIEVDSIKIPSNSFIGIIGKSGSGKTTLLDIFLGLLSPQSGSISIGGKKIEQSNIGVWQKNIGHVPQHIFLSDSTIAENIAFNRSGNTIDMEAVERAARIACIDDFIKNELPDGYNTIIGEKGSRLSGGQRQRIGIARALYTDPKILVMDEGTGALDALTEFAIIDALKNIGRDITILIITHRLKTIYGCDHIYLMDHGKVICSGNYQKLVESNLNFKELHDANI